MRIISGIWKGKSITSPSEGTRPSTDRTRQALFSILQHVVENATVLDLFAGSGALGLESLSRGAHHVVAIESDRRSCAVIKRNVTSLGAQNYDVLQSDVISFLDSPPRKTFDLIFADPPYEQDFENSLLMQVIAHPSWPKRATSNTYLVTESPNDLSKTTLIPKYWKPVTSRNYGKCHITILQYSPE